MKNNVSSLGEEEKKDDLPRLALMIEVKKHCCDYNFC